MRKFQIKVVILRKKNNALEMLKIVPSIETILSK